MFYRRDDLHQADPFLFVKMVLFTIGATMAVAGMAIQNTLVIAGAVVVLLIGFALRFAGPRVGEGEAAARDEMGGAAGRATAGGAEGEGRGGGEPSGEADGGEARPPG